jgi:hypothetical protein
MGRAHVVIFAVVTVAVCSCGASGSVGQPQRTGSPLHYLLTIDQLATPDFTVVEPPHSVDAATLTRGDVTQQRSLKDQGFAAAASVSFFRQADLATSNGPLEVIATVESFGSPDGAHHIYGADTQRRDASQGESPVSTGSLGDEAHADTEVSTAPSGIPAVQITIEWRVANLIDLLVVRGRYGGTRLADALLLAHRMTTGEDAPQSHG